MIHNTITRYIPKKMFIVQFKSALKIFTHFNGCFESCHTRAITDIQVQMFKVAYPIKPLKLVCYALVSDLKHRDFWGGSLSAAMAERLLWRYLHTLRIFCF